MNRPLLTLATLLALTGCATPPALPAAAPHATSNPPVPTAPPPQAVMAQPALLPPGIFRLHIESPVPIPLTEHLGIVDTHYRVASVTVTESTRLACVSPCDAVIDAQAGHAFTLDATEFPAPGPFHLPAGQGGNLTLFVELAAMMSEGTMKETLDEWDIAYDLAEDEETVRLVQRATLTTKDFGLVPEVALYGSEDWWAAIADGRIPKAVLVALVQVCSAAERVRYELCRFTSTRRTDLCSASPRHFFRGFCRTYSTFASLSTA